MTPSGEQLPHLSEDQRQPVLGLRANWRQFGILVLVNAFVGAMVGLERTVLPVIAAEEFAVASKSAILAFIATFGLTKAFANLAAGWLVDQRGRRWTLIAGWIIALPLPLVIWAAPSWAWIVAANALLGINQGLSWSATVIMKIDLVGPRRRGLAMGLNEFAGYVAVAVAGFASGVVAARLGLRAGPAYVGMAIALTGLFTSALLVKDTTAHARVSSEHAARPSVPALSVRQLLYRSIWSDASFFSISQAGFVNNLNDGLAWGLFPLLFIGAGLSLEATAGLTAIYPAVWGVSQIMTGALSDRCGRKRFIVSGMIVQGLALLGLIGGDGIAEWTVALVGLGAGTALVYPTLLAAVGDIVPAADRAPAVGVYRLWRDLGYVAGAVLAGALADALGTPATIVVVAFLTIASGIVVLLRYHEGSGRGAAASRPGSRNR